jgi:hypothetical protein
VIIAFVIVVRCFQEVERVEDTVEEGLRVEALPEVINHVLLISRHVIKVLELLKLRLDPEVAHFGFFNAAQFFYGAHEWLDKLLEILLSIGPDMLD